jgi:hypothetical protein
MILDPQHKAAFAEYEESLQKLEGAFNFAGERITFHGFVAPPSNKMVVIVDKNPNKRSKIICIEGDNPAQAVKDVAAGVWL